MSKHSKSSKIQSDHKPVSGCPCLYTTPCDENCTCVSPWSSRGCARCASYGSDEQRKSKAAWLAKIIDGAK